MANRRSYASVVAGIRDPRQNQPFRDGGRRSATTTPPHLKGAPRLPTMLQDEALKQAVQTVVNDFLPKSSRASVACPSFLLEDLVLTRHVSTEEQNHNVDPQVQTVVDAGRTRSGRRYGAADQAGGRGPSSAGTSFGKKDAWPSIRNLITDSVPPLPLVTPPAVQYHRELRPAIRPRPSFERGISPPRKRVALAEHTASSPHTYESASGSKGKNRARGRRSAASGGARSQNARDPAAAKASAKTKSEARNARRWEKKDAEIFTMREGGLNAHDLRIGKTGWMGVLWPKELHEQMVSRWLSGEIRRDVLDFVRIPFAPRQQEQHVTYLTDAASRLFCARSSPSPAINDLLAAFAQEADQFMRECVSFLPDKIYGNKRGHHWFSICGYDRNNKELPGLSEFHRKNEAAIKKFFREKGPAYRISGFGNSFVRMHFPQIAERFDNAAEKLEAMFGIRRQYGLFWNFCLNGPRPAHGVPRVYCWPHIDWKNVAIAVCLVFVYGEFDHREKAWLVLWEAGVIIEIPPGIFIAYPSSLFYHFNQDIDALDFVTTSNGERPTPTNSTRLTGADNRGSAVWFTQASMLQTAETGYSTLDQAKLAGHSGTCDAKELIEERSCFPVK